VDVSTADSRGPRERKRLMVILMYRVAITSLSDIHHKKFTFYRCLDMNCIVLRA
jgi:hypothetical protein